MFSGGGGGGGSGGVRGGDRGGRVAGMRSHTVSSSKWRVDVTAPERGWASAVSITVPPNKILLRLHELHSNGFRPAVRHGEREDGNLEKEGRAWQATRYMSVV